MEATKFIDSYTDIIKSELSKYKPKREIKDHLWVVRINGNRYSSKNGKHTWTSKTRAKKAIYEYIADIYYPSIYKRIYDVLSEKQINCIIDKLIEENVIYIEQIF